MKILVSAQEKPKAFQVPPASLGFVFQKHTPAVRLFPAGYFLGTHTVFSKVTLLTAERKLRRALALLLFENNDRLNLHIFPPLFAE